jgi:hypothetical protein
MSRQRTRIAMVIALLGLYLSAGLLMPIGHTLWSEQLGGSGQVQVAGGLPQPQNGGAETPVAAAPVIVDTATPETSTHSPAPAATTLPTETATTPAGASLEASVSVAAVGSDEAGRYVVGGEVCVTNSGDQPTDGLAITAQVQFQVTDTAYVEVLEARQALAGLAPLAPGARQCYPVQITFTALPGASYQLAARAAINNHAGWLPGEAGCPGPEACAYGPTTQAALPALVPAATPTRTAAPPAENAADATRTDPLTPMR